MRTRRLCPALSLLAIACGPDPEIQGPTWHADIAPIVEARCAGCHRPGEIGPFPLTSYAEVSALAVPVRSAIASGSMPPWQPADGCNDYVGDSSLPEAEREALLAWIDAGAPEGDPAEAAPLPERPAPFEADLSLALPEPYTPTIEPDDYRCQLVEWPLDETVHITGLRVEPDQRAIVHHTIVFAATAEQMAAFRALDEAAEGPGYPCFGGPTGAGGTSDDPPSADEILDRIRSGQLDGAVGTRWLGAWVPGADAQGFPEGTGLKMSPGDGLVVQMHYNTSSSDPVADQSSIAFRIATEGVAREAVVMPLTDLGWVTGLDLLGGPMTIPAGAPEVTHEALIEGDGLLMAAARTSIGLGTDDPLMVHAVGHHMHQLGVRGRQELRRADGTRTCLLDLPDWDFSWQGSYQLGEAAALQPGDALFLSCSWDNSPEHQPIVDGAVHDPVDVAWGEGTTDEMCLSTLYLTGP